MSLGYISEIERGQKEASSELLAALCEALDVPLSGVLREVSDQVAVEELALEAARRPPRPGWGCRLGCVRLDGFPRTSGETVGWQAELWPPTPA